MCVEHSTNVVSESLARVFNVECSKTQVGRRNDMMIISVLYSMLA